MSTTAPTDLLEAAAIEAEIAKLLAQRTALKHVPGTHAKQDRLLAQASDLFDQLVELRRGCG